MQGPSSLPQIVWGCVQVFNWNLVAELLLLQVCKYLNDKILMIILDQQFQVWLLKFVGRTLTLLPIRNKLQLHYTSALNQRFLLAFSQNNAVQGERLESSSSCMEMIFFFSCMIVVELDRRSQYSTWTCNFTQCQSPCFVFRAADHAHSLKEKKKGSATDWQFVFYLESTWKTS